MAESRRSDLSINENFSVDADWPKGSPEKRYNIMQDIVKKKSLDRLRAIVDSGWDVNEQLHCFDRKAWRHVHEPGLYNTTKGGWIQGVEMLLDAGAKTTRLDGSDNLLALALQNQDCPIGLIRLLLEHGVDPNDHDDRGGCIPLLKAISNCRYSKHNTTFVELLLEHGANPNITLRMNEGGYSKPKWVNRYNALQSAAYSGATKLVKILIAAGAECNASNGLNTLAAAVSNHTCPPALIRLLLKHGADPNDHDGGWDNIPLLVAIAHLRQNSRIIVDLLLEYGANPAVTYRKPIHGVLHGVLHEAAISGWTQVVRMFIDADFVTPSMINTTLALALQNSRSQPDLIELLLKKAYLKYSVEGDWPLIHQLSRHTSGEEIHIFFKQLQRLDLFFLHGGNINMEDGLHKTALEYEVTYDPEFFRGGGMSTVRWLIRRGADISCIAFSCLKEYFIPFPFYIDICPQIPLLLLQAGMRVSQAAQAQLCNMEVALSTFLQEGTVEECSINTMPSDTGPEGNIFKTLQYVWGQIEAVQDEELQYRPKKAIFPEYLSQQMVDLQEFSDESLHVFPDYIDSRLYRKELYQESLDQIHSVLDFLSEPQSLQWYCRRCVRENLVSLQPSVVNTLPVPSRLKRYILCHEI